MLPLMITGLLDGLYATEFYQNILQFDTQILIFLQEIIRNDDRNAHSAKEINLRISRNLQDLQKILEKE